MFTLVLIAVVATYIIAVTFFRRMYFMLIEIEARLIQIRNMMEADRSSEKKAHPDKGQSGKTVAPAVRPQQSQPR
jgi:hypothetical protein